jgi:hypothetical protein
MDIRPYIYDLIANYVYNYAFGRIRRKYLNIEIYK